MAQPRARLTPPDAARTDERAPGRALAGDDQAPPLDRAKRAALMPRPRSGQIREELWKDGETIGYSARVYAYGRREYVTLRDQQAGLEPRARRDRARADRPADRARDVGAAAPPSEGGSTATAMAQLGVKVDESFRVFAQRWWNSKQLRVSREHGQRLRVAAGVPSAVLRPLRGQRDRRRARRSLPRRAAPAGRNPPRRRRAEASADRDRHRPPGPHLRAASTAAVEHVDQRDDHAARTDPAAGRRLRTDPSQPGARRRSHEPLPAPRRRARARSSRSTSSTRCSTPPAHSTPRHSSYYQGHRAPRDGRRARARRLSHQRAA